MIINGTWFSPNSASHQTAVLTINDTLLSIQGDTEQLWQGAASKIEISSRVGNIPRTLNFSDGSVFSTDDNDSIDKWLKQSNHKAHNSGILHLLESQWRWVFASVVMLFVLTFITFKWGLPAASEKIANALPIELNESLASGTMATLDKFLFKPSKTSPAKQQALRRHFKQNLLPDNQQGFNFTLHFRHMPGGNTEEGLANAFALPSGELVVTDRLLSLAKDQDEVDAILLHEIGHVLHRHSMRQVIQSSAITVALILVTGDISAIEEWTVALPGFLLESSYSRSFESEADHYAFERMLVLDKDPKSFATMLARITTDVEEDEDGDKAKNEDKNKGWIKYLSSHPTSDDRIEQARKYSELYKAKHKH